MDSILPYVRLIIPCAKAELVGAGEDQHYVLKEPVSTLDAQQNPLPLAMYVVLSGGLQSVPVQVEVRYSADGNLYKFLTRSQSFDVGFSVEQRGINGAIVAFTFKRGVPIKFPGLYEFRLVSGDQELPGARAEVRVLA